ncbi:MbtH family NRPS accessory protein [Runella sp. SP2]|uniref:MbtH family NRPS accessory protein n=1 Tax=Runella sp. SP2 TaxID=2268026 RepID=UPI000F0809F9|nr:MbtH family NRPS accessory protein [Runella sp. SP2]AYQ33312.1 hypothetical protein DTQ70_14600 [Runella sp. SP2]
MENYLLNNLIVRISNPSPNFEVSNRTLQWFIDTTTPNLLVVAKGDELDAIEMILNEIAIEYINTEKLWIFLVDGVKANILSPDTTPTMQNAWVLTDFVEYPESESFYKAKRGLKITKKLLKEWLDFQMSFIKKYCYGFNDESYQLYTNYIVVTNNKGEYKVWIATVEIPQGWEDAGLYCDRSRIEAVECAKRYRNEYLEDMERVKAEQLEKIAPYKEVIIDIINSLAGGKPYDDDTIIKKILPSSNEVVAAQYFHHHFDFYREFHEMNLDENVTIKDTIKTLRDNMLNVFVRRYESN